ncbi:methyl-accepting chemotaxis protein [Gemmobacter denitrificans]|uniref:Methyl-accepting chemotaxis protein n=1 Tax=Gemmobacter denitrificans TaxID=3123040 RepID=A0ABU8BTI5_9RHOB
MPRRSTSLRIKLALSAAALTAIAIVTVVYFGITMMTRASIEEAEEKAQALMGEYVAMITQDMNRVTETVRIGSASVEAVLASGQPNRDMLGRMVTEMLKTRPDLVGMTLAFEPNSLGDEALSIGHPYSDVTGRFVPYFYYGPDKKIKVELLDMRPEAGTESWYDMPLREDRMLITPPYIYPVNGVDVLMTTISGVVHRNKRAIGIMTSDIALSELSQRVGQLRPFGEGYVQLVSSDGQWIANSDPGLLGKPVSAEDKAWLTQPGLHYATINGEEFMVLVGTAEFIGVSETWPVLMKVPSATVMAHVTETKNQAIMAGGAMLLVTLVVVWLGAQVISRPIEGMTSAMKRLANGQLDTSIPHAGRRDEIGAMASAMEVFRNSAVEAKRLEQEATAIRLDREAAAKAEAERQARVVREISTGLDRLASGDMTYQIESPPHDPFPEGYDSLRLAFNTVVTRLAQTMTRISEVVQQVRAGADEINMAAGELSGRAETQAATLEQSAAALNQMNESLRDTAERARAVEAVSGQNREIALASATVVNNAVAAMRGIERSSDQISRIIGVIDDIAFQTNLLALNAGVEAARAGDAGHGFAVVASEVRNLAQRAAESAREVRGLIQESSAQVKTGSELVGKTGDSLDVIVKKAAEVSEQIAAIAVAARDQSVSLNEINVGVRQLDQVTQQNAAMAEEATAASVALRQQAGVLAGEIGAFQMSERASVTQMPLPAFSSKRANPPRARMQAKDTATARQYEEF